MRHHEAHMRIIKRGLVCVFLLLAVSSAEAMSISYRFSPSRNLSKFGYDAKHMSVTNTPVNTLQPVCDVLKKKNVTGYSFKQWHFLGIFEKVCVGAACALGVLSLTLIFSKGMSFFLWLLFFFSGSALNHDPGSAFVMFVLPNLLAGGIILTKDFPRASKAVAGICLVVFVVSLGAIGLINLNGHSYLDDYSFPEYLVSSTSTNIVVIHEKLDLPYCKYGNGIKELLFRDGRRSTVRPYQLTALLQAQAEAIRRFKQETTQKKPE